MAYDEFLAGRVRKLIARHKNFTERKMFGGICFMLSGNMACGVLADALIVRVPKDQTEAVLKRKHTRPFDFTGKGMKGFAVVEASGLKRAEQLRSWVEASANFAASLPRK